MAKKEKIKINLSAKLKPKRKTYSKKLDKKALQE
tara:strand:- start:94 stop:195 length:102 start_codon:yes stop_codon:yes gene_type:complete